MINVLFITHDDNQLGSSRSLLNLLDGLDKNDINPIVITDKDGPLKKELEDRHIISYTLPISWWVTRKPVTVKRVINLTIGLIRATQPYNEVVIKHLIDVIYTNTSVYPIGRIIAFLNRIPHIWHIREFGKLDFSLNYIYPETFHNLIIKSSTAIICNSNAIKNYYFQNSNRRSIHVIYNGIAFDNQFKQFAERRKTTLPNKTYTFIIIGSIIPPKGQDVAIRALSVLRSRGLDSQLLIVGTGENDYLKYLKELAADLNVEESVIFTGYLSDPYEAFYFSDCMLMCSQHEAMGRVTVEAMSACLPVIGNDSGGTPELIQHGKSGFLYNTFEELTNFMCIMVENPELGSQFGSHGWQYVRENFTIENYSSSIRSIIQSCVNKI